ncbi:MAG: replicative DNA helicase [Gammaproteobacteria bacterium GWF2_41_13]|nr:MAG: replicative DNA helicase [Gammaproteobacteria bacterium GWF2_41_13]
MADEKKPIKKKRASDVDVVKMPPHSTEAELSLLGGLMLDNQAWDKIVDRISAIDFYHQRHRLIFDAMMYLSSKDRPLDALTISEALKSREQLSEIGDESYLFELANNALSATNIVAYADIIREKSILRQLIGVTNSIADNAFNPQGRDSLEVLDDAERQIFAIAEQKKRGRGVTKIDSLLAKAIDRIDTLYHSDQTITGLSVGYHDFDEMTSGLQPADLIIVAGRPSMGKTAFAMNIAEHAAINNSKPILVFSMEMPGEALAMRIISSLSRIDQHKVRTGRLEDEDWPRITSAVNLLAEAKLFVDDTPALSPAELRARARRLAREQGDLGLIIVDYLQLMQVPGFRENRTTEVSEISRTLKAIAKELHVPILALSQLNRSLEARSDKRPVMSDLRESGGLEQDADVIVFIYRDEVYNENSPDKGKAEIIIAKQRNGPIGKLFLTFLGKFTRFENYTPDIYTGGTL